MLALTLIRTLWWRCQEALMKNDKTTIKTESKADKTKAETMLDTPLRIQVPRGGVGP